MVMFTLRDAVLTYLYAVASAETQLKSRTAASTIAPKDQWPLGSIKLHHYGGYRVAKNDRKTYVLFVLFLQGCVSMEHFDALFVGKHYSIKRTINRKRSWMEEHKACGVTPG